MQGLEFSVEALQTRKGSRFETRSLKIESVGGL